MDIDKLMDMSVDKIINELSWDSIEFLFKPTNQGELLLRFDFEGMKEKVAKSYQKYAGNRSPMEYQYLPYFSNWQRAIWKESFYRKIKKHKRKETKNS